MNIVCKNCNNHFDGKYCNLCGQPADTQDINGRFIWHDIKLSLLHYDAGVIFTIKQLMIRPGIAIRNYIEGKRVGYIKPIALVLLMAGAYGFLYTYYTIDFSSLIKENDPIKSDFSKFNHWMGANYATVQLLFLPFLSFTSFVVFYKSRLNFFKHLVMNAFLAGQRLFIGICLFPLIYYFNGKPELRWINYGLSFLGAIILVWAYMQFFDHQSKIKILFLALITYLLYFIELVLIGVGLENLYVSFLK